MTDWQITGALIMGGAALGLIWNISAKVEQIARLLEEDARRRDHAR